MSTPLNPSAPAKLESIQQLFDEMVGHVIEQGRPGASVDVSYSGRPKATCVYQGEDGTACSVGKILAKYGVYSPVLEGKAIYDEWVKVVLRCIGCDDQMIELAKAVQYCHDSAAQASVGYDGFNNEAFMRDFVSQVKEVGVNYGLSLNVLGVTS